MFIFYWYVIKEHIAPFVFAFSVIMFIFIIKLMLQLMDMLIRNHVDLLIMAKMFMYNMPWMIALVVPMSVLISTLMAFGRMGASGEITAMKSAGISMYRIVAPVFIIAIGITFFMIWFNNVVLPESNHRARNLFTAISLNKPILALKNREGQFISDTHLPDITLKVDKIDYATGIMSGVTLFRREDAGYNTSIVAETGKFETYPEGNKLAVKLTDGELHRTNYEQNNRYIRIKFREFKQIIELDSKFNPNQETSKTDRTSTAAEMRQSINENLEKIARYNKEIAMLKPDNPTFEAQSDNFKTLINSCEYQNSEYLVEIHKKNSIPFAALIFVLIGASMGILVRKSGASIGIGMSIGFFTLYYMFLIGGESAGDRMLVEPWLSMWLPTSFSALLASR